ncbi:unnamed protein product [Adineta ricciae]|uniref:Uncharacterized protein n=1 Tax=Adineta ricciae TaxID=249248 RepID=A0A815SJD9_ADIRI|nr:unnamed protein product [Adineta ricciae]
MTNDIRISFNKNVRQLQINSGPSQSVLTDLCYELMPIPILVDLHPDCNHLRSVLTLDLEFIRRGILASLTTVSSTWMK